MNDSFDELINQAGQQFNVDPRLIKTVFHLESSGNPDIGDSVQGAQGGMQIMPDTAKMLGVDPKNIQESIFGAAKYLRMGLDAHGNDPNAALAFYHGGPDTNIWGPKTRSFVAKGQALYPNVQLTAGGGPSPSNRSEKQVAGNTDITDHKSLMDAVFGSPTPAPGKQTPAPPVRLSPDTPATASAKPAKSEHDQLMEDVFGPSTPAAPPASPGSAGQPNQEPQSGLQRVVNGAVSLLPPVDQAKDVWDAGARGWNNAETLLNPDAQNTLDSHQIPAVRILGGLVHVGNGLWGAGNAVAQGGIQALGDTATTLAKPLDYLDKVPIVGPYLGGRLHSNRLANDVASMPESGLGKVPEMRGPVHFGPPDAIARKIIAPKDVATVAAETANPTPRTPEEINVRVGNPANPIAGVSGRVYVDGYKPNLAEQTLLPENAKTVKRAESDPVAGPMLSAQKAENNTVLVEKFKNLPEAKLVQERYGDITKSDGTVDLDKVQSVLDQAKADRIQNAKDHKEGKLVTSKAVGDETMVGLQDIRDQLKQAADAKAMQPKGDRSTRVALGKASQEALGWLTGGGLGGGVEAGLHYLGMDHTMAAPIGTGVGVAGRYVMRPLIDNLANKSSRRLGRAALGAK